MTLVTLFVRGFPVWLPFHSAEIGLDVHVAAKPATARLLRFSTPVIVDLWCKRTDRVAKGGKYPKLEGEYHSGKNVEGKGLARLTLSLGFRPDAK